MKRKKYAVAAIAGMTAAGLTIATGCGDAVGMSASTENLTKQYAKEQTDYRDTEVTSDFAKSYTDFALQLLRESRGSSVKRESDETAIAANTMVSPLSVMAALEMTSSGARGETATQMGQVLYGQMESGEAGRELMAYMRGLPSGEKVKFHFANSLWLHTGDTAFVPSEDFLKNSVADYGAEIYGSLFDEQTRLDINRWVKTETDGMIPNMLDWISPDAILYLINAVAFDAEWQEIYTDIQVHDADFYLEDGSTKTVSMMYAEEQKFLRDEMATGFVKPYAEDYAFVALLPREGTKVDDYLAGLTGEDFLRVLENAKSVMVETALPKFTADTELELSDIMQDMGMKLAFDEENADFSGMGTCDGGTIYINRVIHKTHIEVDEKGTKAGAAQL